MASPSLFFFLLSYSSTNLKVRGKALGWGGYLQLVQYPPSHPRVLSIRWCAIGYCRIVYLLYSVLYTEYVQYVQYLLRSMQGGITVTTSIALCWVCVELLLLCCADWWIAASYICTYRQYCTYSTVRFRASHPYTVHVCTCVSCGKAYLYGVHTYVHTYILPYLQYSAYRLTQATASSSSSSSSNM